MKRFEIKPRLWQTHPVRRCEPSSMTHNQIDDYCYIKIYHPVVSSLSSDHVPCNEIVSHYNNSDSISMCTNRRKRTHNVYIAGRDGDVATVGGGGWGWVVGLGFPRFGVPGLLLIPPVPRGDSRPRRDARPP